MTAGTPLGGAGVEPVSRRPASLRTQRLRWTWLLAPPFFFLAQPTPGWLTVGVALAGLGLLLRAAAAGFILKEQALATGGPYAVVRHPLYLGSFLVGLGFALASSRWWMVPLFAAGYLALYGQVVLREEAHLEETFGEPYRRYRNRVPVIVPRLARDPDREPDGGFQFALYRRNSEWEAAVGVAIGFGLLWCKMVWVG